MEDKKKLQGKRLQEVRKILGKTQVSFCDWLTEHGVTGNYDEPYKQKTIAAWESGRRNVPDEIKKVLSDNVTVDGYPVQFAYLNGDTDFITQSTGAIVKHAFEVTDSILKNTSNWKQATAADIKEMTDAPLNRFGITFLNDMLPIYNHSKNDFFDIMRFNRYMYEEIGRLIEEYLQNEQQGK